MNAIRWTCVLGVVLAGAACDEPQSEPEAGSVRQNLTTNERILGFERVSAAPADSDWKTSGGLLSTGAPPSEGAQALGISNIGWALLESAPLSALGAVSSSAKLDVRLPGTGTVPWGDVQLFVESPQLSLFNQPVGQVTLVGKTAGVYQTLEFPLPSALQGQLAGAGYGDLVVRIAINVPQTSSPVLVDHLTFGGLDTGTGGNGGGGSSSSTPGWAA
jgi:hypothetical protein